MVIKETKIQPMITITKELFDELSNRSLKLDAFYSLNVEKWKHYKEAIKTYNELLEKSKF